MPTIDFDKKATAMREKKETEKAKTKKAPSLAVEERLRLINAKTESALAIQRDRDERRAAREARVAQQKAIDTDLRLERQRIKEEQKIAEQKKRKEERAAEQEKRKEEKITEQEKKEEEKMMKLANSEKQILGEVLDVIDQERAIQPLKDLFTSYNAVVPDTGIDAWIESVLPNLKQWVNNWTVRKPTAVGGKQLALLREYRDRLITIAGLTEEIAKAREERDKFKQVWENTKDANPDPEELIGVLKEQYYNQFNKDKDLNKKFMDLFEKKDELTYQLEKWYKNEFK